MMIVKIKKSKNVLKIKYKSNGKNIAKKLQLIKNLTLMKILILK